LLTGKPKNAGPTAANLKAKRNYNLAHSKSRVANILGTPGNFKYTNKERIEANYQKALETLKTIEKPAESASALRTVVDRVQTALQTPEARTAGAVAITIPIGVAQLFVKLGLLFLAVLTFLFIDIPSMGQIPVSAYVAPNKSFNTTRAAYNQARRLTGANAPATVVKDF
jgi:hypothetical protein